MKRQVVDLAQIAAALSRRRPQVVGPPARHDRRPRRHGVHDARVREPRAHGRALPVRAARGLAADRLGRELQDRRRHDDRADHRVSRRGHQGDRPSGHHGRSGLGGHRRRRRLHRPGRQGQGGRHLQHVRAGRAQPFGQRSRGPLQRQHPRRPAGRRDGGQRDGRSRQRPVSARGRLAPDPAVHVEHGRRLRAEGPARQGREGRAELPARRARAAERRDRVHDRHAARDCPTSRSS